MSSLAAATCPSCDAPRVPGAQFCYRCGAALDTVETRIAERRVVTVLFGDLSDFTAWAEDLDPERVGVVIDRVLAALTAAVADFGGHVDKLTGDGIMAVFGAPVAHEDDALRAVRAAAAMQAAIQQLVAGETGGGTQLGLRVGLNTGEVLAGVQAALSYTVVGDTVNTASRLSDVARVGAVVAGRETVRATTAEASWRPLAPLRLKGKREQVTAYELVGLRTSVGGQVAGVGDEAPLLGRDDELGVCVQAVLDTVELGTPSALLVIGEAGLGKKRIAQELGRFVGELPGSRVLWGRCWPYGEGRDLGPVLDMLRTLLGVDEAASAGTQAEQVRGALDRLAPGCPPQTVEELLALLGLGAGGPTPPGPAGAAGSGLEPFAQLLSVLAQAGPLLLVLDGIQWATESMRDLLVQASARLSGPVVIMALGRPELMTEFREEVYDQLPRHRLITLRPLDLATSDQLLRSHLGADLDAPARAALLDRAEGNPLFLAEVLHLLVDRGVLVRQPDGRWSLREEIGEDVLPAGVQALLAARVDELDPVAKAVLRDASVAGLHFDAQTLVAIASSGGAQVDATLVDQALERLVAGGYARVDERAGAAGRRGYVFVHAMARDVAYAGVPKADRARRHAAVAQWAEQQRADAPTAPLRLPAGSADGTGTQPGTGPGLDLDVDLDPQPDLDALVAWQGRRALELAREMRLPQSDPVWQVRDLTVRALLRSARTAVDRQDAQALVDQLSDAVTLASDPAYGTPWRPDLLGRPRVALGSALATLAQVEESERTLLAEVEHPDPTVRAEAVAALAELRRRQGRDTEAGELGRQALELARTTGQGPLAARLQRALGLAAYLGGRLQEAGELYRAALEDSRLAGDRRGEAWALQQLAWTATTRGDYPVAEKWLVLAAEAFAALEDTVGLSWCTGTEGLVRLFQGRYREAVSLAQGLLPLGDAVGDRWGAAACRVIVAYACAGLGDTATAREAAQGAAATFAELGDPWGSALAALALSAVEREDGHPTAALTAATAAQEQAQRSGSSLVVLLARTQAGLILIDLDRLAEADEAAQQALAQADEAGLQPHAAVAALVVRGRVAARDDPGRGRMADPARARELLAEAERRSSGQPPMLFSRRAVLAWYARALAGCGELDEAVRYTDRALAQAGSDRRALVLAHVVQAEVALLRGDEAAALTAALSAREAAGPEPTPLQRQLLAPVEPLLARVDSRHG